MASLSDSLRLKAAGSKAPAISGAAPLMTPDTPLDEGRSGGIAKSKQVKNAASTTTGKPTPGSDFLRSMGGSTASDKTTGYF